MGEERKKKGGDHNDINKITLHKQSKRRIIMVKLIYKDDRNKHMCVITDTDLNLQPFPSV